MSYRAGNLESVPFLFNSANADRTLACTEIQLVVWSLAVLYVPPPLRRLAACLMYVCIVLIHATRSTRKKAKKHKQTEGQTDKSKLHLQTTS